VTLKELEEYRNGLKLDHWTQKGKSLHDMAPGIQPSRDAHNAAWLWLKKLEADTGEKLSPVDFLQRREALALIIETEAISNAVSRRNKEITQAQRTAARRELLQILRQILTIESSDDITDLEAKAREMIAKYGKLSK